jgi:ligand-binding sensor domain-containing protein
MIRKRILLVLLMFSLIGLAQNNQWKGYFSYNQIKDISQSNTAIYAASENALFSKNIQSNDIKTLNSVDGLKAETITSIYYSVNYKKTFIGNKNGLLLILNADGSILYKNGILTEVPVSPFTKKINHFYEYQGKIYISCDYGISVFNMATLEFGDTYYISNGGVQGRVYQTTILNNEIYAVTEFFGIKKGLLSNPSLVDYNQWITVDTGYLVGMVNFQNQLIAYSTDFKVYKFTGTNYQEIVNVGQPGLDIRENGNHLIFTSKNHVYVYNESLVQIAHVQTNQITDIPVTFTCATVLNNNIYIGTNENGIVTCPLNNPSSFQFIMPDGPERNRIFRLKKTPTTLWTLYGEYNSFYNPYNPNPPYTPFEYPISKYTEGIGWDIIPYSELFQAKSLSNIAVNPNNENELYVSSYFSGLLKVENSEPTILYNAENTGSNGLETLIIPPSSGNPNPDPSYRDIRINGPAYDKSGNLWMTNSFVNKGLKVFKASGQWQSYALEDIINTPIEESYGVLVVDKNNTKWIPSAHNGLIGFNENYNNKFIVVKSQTEGNLPSNDVRCLAIDNKNQLWIGTDKGLRIITSVDLFLSQTEIESKSIIILENDLAQELFFDQFVVDILVDGANRKWVSIADAGVFLITPNGQQTIYHFTKENSPLPSNFVYDIEIDSATGEVFFATDKGLVSFKGTATKSSDNLENVYVYPNPVRPEFFGTVKISGLTNKAIVKITDIEGNLVHETTSEGGTIEWDTTAFGKYRVASGVYMIFISAEDGIETKVKKVMIVR